ncbi:MAG: transglutaminase-like domain-containing protein [Ruminococcus sp.]|jgi:transglutaminase-like putative cysteine protease|nr:transglutaminase-like domain-containing protein [Ruminococcus sp.]
MKGDATRAYITIETPKAGLLLLCDLLLVIATAIGSLLAGNAFTPEALMGVLTAASLTALLLYPRKRFSLPNAKFMLLFMAAAAVLLVFFFRQNIVAYIAGMIAEDCQDLLSDDDIKKSAFALCFLFIVLLFYLQKYLRLPLLIMILSLIPLFSTFIYRDNTESIASKIGIITLVIVWIAQIIWHKNSFGNFLCHAFAFGIICMAVGITIVYGFGIHPSDVEIEQRLKSDVNSPEQTLNIHIELNEPLIEKKRKWSEIIGESEGVSNLLTDGRLSFDDTLMLEASMDFDAFDGSPVYLRHFFGADYNGTAWSELDDDSKAALSEVISQFSSQNLTPSNLDSFSYSEFYELYRFETATTPFQIRKASMDTDETFLPYLTDMGDEFFGPDGDIINTGNVYSGTVNMPNGFYANNQILSTILLGESVTENPELQADELLYRDFVYNTYLDVPQEFIIQNPVFDDGYMEYITEEDIETGKSTLTSDQIFARKVNYIHRWLRDNCEYEINIDDKPSDKDFALYFLNESREGFCQHFATVSTLLCRAAGIPARYVTGFIIPESDYEGALDGVVAVNDSRAHAWTEIYVDGYGWLPIDFTPGYSNVRTSLTAARREQQRRPQAIVTEPQVPVTTALTPPINQISEPVPEPVKQVSETPQSTDDTDVYRMVFIPLCVIAFIVLVILLRRRLNLFMYAKKLSSENGFDTLMCRTKYILNTEKMPVSQLLSDRAAYLKVLEESCYGFVTPILKMALSVKFGGEKLSESEVRDLNTLLDEAISLYYRKQKLTGKLKLKYILNLL